MSAELDVRGFEGLFDNLQKVKTELRQRIAQNAVNAGARVIRDEARTRVPVRTGRTQRQIRVITRRTGLGVHEVAASVGLRGGGKKGRVHIARFLEFGVGPHEITSRDSDAFKSLSADAQATARLHVFTTARSRGASGKKALRLARGAFRERVMHPGIPPKPFLRPAYDAKRQEAINAMATALRRGIERAIAKGGGISPSATEGSE